MITRIRNENPRHLFNDPPCAINIQYRCYLKRVVSEMKWRRNIKKRIRNFWIRNKSYYQSSTYVEMDGDSNYTHFTFLSYSRRSPFSIFERNQIAFDLSKEDLWNYNRYLLYTLFAGNSRYSCTNNASVVPTVHDR